MGEEKLLTKVKNSILYDLTIGIYVFSGFAGVVSLLYGMWLAFKMYELGNNETDYGFALTVTAAVFVASYLSYHFFGTLHEEMKRKSQDSDE